MKRITKLLLSSAASMIIPSSLLAISCYKLKDIYLDINVASRLFLNRLTLNQIASIEKDFIIDSQNTNDKKGLFFYFDKKENKKIYFDDVKIEKEENEEPKMYLKKGNQWIEYIPDFIYKKNWKQEKTNNNNIRVLHSKKNATLGNFLTEYEFNEIDDLSNDYDEWLINLFAKQNTDFKPQQYEFPEDLQSIIFRLNYDVSNNFFIMNKNYIKNAKNEQTLFLDWMHPHYIQASAFLDNEHIKQRKTFERILKLYLNQFNLNVASIEIDWKKAKIKKSITSSSQNFISFNLKSITDWNNNELLTDNDRKKTFYLNGFRSYASNAKFGVGNQGLKEDLPLFNDYIENPLLYMDGKEYLTIIDNINHFIKAPTSHEYWNSKGLMHLFNQFKDEIFYIKIPSYRKNEDKEYKITDFEFTDYLGTNQIFKAIVQVTKLNGTKKSYVWISSNFDDHGHRLKGMITKNTPSPLSSDIYSFNPGNKGNPEGIKLNEFISDDPNSAFMVGLKNASDKLNLFNYWNNDSRQNFDADLLNNESYQIKVFNSYLNNYLLAYALEVKKNIPLSGIKRIDIELDAKKNKLGSLYFKLKFVGFGDNRDYKYISKNEKIIAESSLYWNYFKGYDINKNKNTFNFYDDANKLVWIKSNEKN